MPDPLTPEERRQNWMHLHGKHGVIDTPEKWLRYVIHRMDSVTLCAETPRAEKYEQFADSEVSEMLVFLARLADDVVTACKRKLGEAETCSEDTTPIGREPTRTASSS